jgi:hypothetical protein
LAAFTLLCQNARVTTDVGHRALPGATDARSAEEVSIHLKPGDTRGAWWAVGITLGALVVVGIAASQVEDDMEGISFH